MCSILVFAKADNSDADPAIDTLKFKRGYIVDINDKDDFFWGEDIQGKNALGWWRIVLLPGVSAASMLGYCMGDPWSLVTNNYLRLRTKQIDLDAIEAAQGKALTPTDTAILPDKASFDSLASNVLAIAKTPVIGGETVGPVIG